MLLALKYFLPLLTMSSVYLSCDKPGDRCLKAKVLRVSCASFVVQVLNKDSVGEYGWRDVGGHAVYNNVFNISNSCQIGKMQKGEEFYFELEDSLKQSDCIRCMMFDAPPEKSFLVKNVSRRKCK